MYKRMIKTIHGDNEYYLPEEVDKEVERLRSVIKQRDKEIERLKRVIEEKDRILKGVVY